MRVKEKVPLARGTFLQRASDPEATPGGPVPTRQPGVSAPVRSTFYVLRSPDVLCQPCCLTGTLGNRARLPEPQFPRLGDTGRRDGKEMLSRDTSRASSLQAYGNASARAHFLWR